MLDDSPFRDPAGGLRLAVVALVAVGCGAPTTAEADSCGLVGGNLVITEIMADPDGADAGQEWFEIHNVLADAVALDGVVLERAKGDGTARKLWPISTAAEIPPHGFFVVGNVPDDALDLDYLDYGYGDALSALPNSDGYLAVRCGTAVIDAVAYHDVPTGSTWSLDAGAFDAGLNDAMTNWCAVGSRGSSTAGTPGAPNPACDDAAWRLPCIEEGTPREPVLPTVGDVVLSEIHANPAAVPDARGEFLEIYVARSVDLNGLQLKRGPADGSDFVLDDSHCLRAEADSYVVLAAAAEDNGGVPAHHVLDFALPNDAGTILLFSGGELLDQVTHGAAEEGVSYGREIRGEETAASEPLWCFATSAYGAGDRGTPGFPNDSCVPAESPAQCLDAGAKRSLVAPANGDLVITELMQDPGAAPDTVGEWFEICANRGVDLNGVEIGKDGSVADTLVAEECLFVEPGECVVFARSLDRSVNGGVPADFLFTSALVNGAGSLFVAYDGNILDEVSWSSSVVGASASWSGDLLDPVSNDDEAKWCEGASAWTESAGDWGSPGSPNPVCSTVPGSGTCLDGDIVRPLVVPGLGDVVITEVMPNPIGSDTTDEWIELFAFADFDLAAISLGADASQTQAPMRADAPGACLSVAGGDYIVVARSAAAGVEADVVWSRMALSNTTADSLWLGAADVVLDQFSWSDAGEGQSLCRLGPTLSVWGLDGLGGTPGGENTTCNGS